MLDKVDETSNGANTPGTMATIAETIRHGLHAFTPSERKVANVILADYPISGLETITVLASRAGVSAPSILRFLKRIGIKSYPEFQRLLRQELVDLIKPLSDRAAGTRRKPKNGDPFLQEFLDAILRNVEKTFNEIPPGEFKKVVSLLSDHKRRLYIAGGRFTDGLALYAAVHLRVLRPDVNYLASQSAGSGESLIDMGKPDILLVLDVQRYQKDIIAFAQKAAARKVTVVLITDKWLSPIAKSAHHTLTAKVDAPSSWDSEAALVALMEALIAATTKKLWKTAEGRIGALRELDGDEA